MLGPGDSSRGWFPEKTDGQERRTTRSSRSLSEKHINPRWNSGVECHSLRPFPRRAQSVHEYLGPPGRRHRSQAHPAAQPSHRRDQ